VVTAGWLATAGRVRAGDIGPAPLSEADAPHGFRQKAFFFRLCPGSPIVRLALVLLYRAAGATAHLPAWGGA